MANENSEKHVKSNEKFMQIPKKNIGCVWNTSYNHRSSNPHKFKPLLSA